MLNMSNDVCVLDHVNMLKHERMFKYAFGIMHSLLWCLCFLLCQYDVFSCQGVFSLCVLNHAFSFVFYVECLTDVC